jgi:hypothetical protein
VISLALVLLVGAPHALAQNQGPPCNLDRLAGDWGFVTSYTTAGVPATATGTVHLTKDGISSAHLLANMGGTFFEFDRYGNLAVNADCTTTTTWNDGGASAHCVVVDDGNEMWCIYEGPDQSVVTLKRIHTRN